MRCHAESQLHKEKSEPRGLDGLISSVLRLWRWNRYEKQFSPRWARGRAFWEGPQQISDRTNQNEHSVLSCSVPAAHCEGFLEIEKEWIAFSSDCLHLFINSRRDIRRACFGVWRSGWKIAEFLWYLSVLNVRLMDIEEKETKKKQKSKKKKHETNKCYNRKWIIDNCKGASYFAEI